MRFSEFNTSIRLGLKRTPIRAVIIKKSGNDFVKYEMFKRLNTGGSLLAAQEIRNCSCRMISGGAEFYSIIQSYAKYSDFVKASARIPDTDREQRADEELVLRFFAVLNFRDQFAGNVREWLDAYMETMLFEGGEQNLNAPLFHGFFSFIAEKFEDSAFSRWRDGVAQGRLAPAYFEAVVGALANSYERLKNKSDQELRQQLSAAFDDQRFKESTGPGANSKQKMEQRIQVVSEYFA